MPRKDIENVLRNLYCFLEIMQTSRSEEVSSWDEQSLDNALKWAAFAEQVNNNAGVLQVNTVGVLQLLNFRRNIFV